MIALLTLICIPGAILGQGVPTEGGGDPLLYSVMSIADDMVAANGQEAVAEQGEPPAQGEGGGEVQDNGTNPASMGFKFMPYYRYTELNNGIKSIDALTLFTLLPFKPISPFSAFVLEWPVMKSFDGGAVAEDILRDIADGAENGVLPCGPPTCAAPRIFPIEGIARGFDITGVGDFRTRYLQGIKMFQGKKPGASTVLMVGVDVMMPAASDPILGDETWYGSPIFAHIHNLNPESFFAFLHFYFFDWTAKSGTENKDIGFYMGRYFFQKAWSKAGYYVLPELQVIYDNESADDWSVMLMPELGKSWRAGGLGMTGYIKPGWAIDGPDEAERRFSVEFGIRMIPSKK
jgi:hypothetical protein